MIYQNYGLNLTEVQKLKLKKAIKTQQAILLRIAHNNLVGQHNLGLTKTQISKIEKAKQMKRGVGLNITKLQLRKNMKIEGGFLPLLVGLASTILPILTKTILPGLASGIFGGLANTGIQKVLGNGCILKEEVAYVM